MSDNLDEHGYATFYVRYDTNADVMQENAVSERFCLGCGVSVASLKNYEKRLLCGEASGKMLAAWKELFSRKLDELVNVSGQEHLKGTGSPSLSNP